MPSQLHKMPADPALRASKLLQPKQNRVRIDFAGLNQHVPGMFRRWNGSCSKFIEDGNPETKPKQSLDKMPRRTASIYRSFSAALVPLRLMRMK